ncbi:polysaccharide export protein [Salinisphaera hydrothermalis C27AD]
MLGMLAGCALPGFNSGSFDHNHWYSFGSKHSATYQEQLSQQAKVDYDPIELNITPQLIAYLDHKQKKNSLSPQVRKLTGSPSRKNYVVGNGDILQIVVFGHPDLTNPGGESSNNNGGGSRQTGRVDTSGELVNADGDIYFPYVGSLHAAGKTIAQIRKEVTQGLSDYIRDPQVDVRVRQYRSQRVYISGDIDKPCTVPITDINLTIVQALDACDSLASKKGGGTGVQNIRLIRNGHSTLVNLNKLYAQGDDIPLQPGDKLLIDDTANRVFMVGEFDKQKALPYATGGMSLGDAISDIGGVNLQTADASHIYVIRGFVGGRDFKDGGLKTIMHPKIYHLNMSNPSGMLLANQFELKPRDVVFAAPASLVNFNRALSLILPSLNAITQGFYIYDRSGL